jgi:hypothetical protein
MRIYLVIGRSLLYYGPYAGVAQLVEQLTCNQQVVGSRPTASFFVFVTTFRYKHLFFKVSVRKLWTNSLTYTMRRGKIRACTLGGVPEWLKGADCKSAVSAS